MSTTLKHYTELPFLLHVLWTKKLALRSPNLWDDRNDARYLEIYCQRAGWPSVLALCLTHAKKETYHHWKVFAGSLSGVCIEFDHDLFLSWAKEKGIRHDSMEYRWLREAREDPPTLEILPFRKRRPFKDELEFRLICKGETASQLVKEFVLDLNTIDHIVMNPWMPETVFKSVKRSIQTIANCSSLKVQRSRMLENEQWIKIAEKSHRDGK